MQSNLREFLAQHVAVADELQLWGNGNLPLKVMSYLSDTLPPLEYVTSVRSLVVHDNEILVVREQHQMHILPGGRREANETLEITLRREVLEEAGWKLGAIELLGFMHFQHEGPKPPGHPYPYPDFLQPIYLAHAETFHPDAIALGEYEVEPYTLTAIASVPSFSHLIPVVERCFLEAVLASRSSL